ncbi:hypothetical protein MTsPCn9_28960 [Croceitalea sp. MTPC9]|uniref:chaperone modulator CbpM n=1 Tax=unclassified Croceitalea TaxID=2632280 RepID=UPI002B3A0760|nr:hypothetical protein MTsPCn6_30450 [Croceitalea sp. MTPC6]GMN17956.1 hypothetical protein MTsPCn9_28960 [Croceitalea sp. MTPC9]
MEEHLIPISDFCQGYEIEVSFIMGLQEYELIELKTIKNDYFLAIEELPKVERMVRLYQELNINREGIEAIYHLLERTELMREELFLLKQRLKRYEGI